MKKCLGKKGVTLAELVVVLAILAIVSTMVTTFCILINGYNTVNRKRAQITESLAGAEQIVADFLMAYDSTQYTVSATAQRITVTQKASASTYQLSVTANKITAALPSGEKNQTVAGLESVAFTLQQSGNKCLILCTLTYWDPKLNKSNNLITHTFAVAPKLLQKTA